MSRMIGICLLLIVSSQALGQSVSVEVWTHARPETPPQPTSKASVRMYPAANMPTTTNVNVQKPEAGGPRANEYVLDSTTVARLVDINVRQPGYHPWTARDLYAAPGENQKLSVQLFEYSYPIKAPQCFALKTEYELLFREEQRLAPQLQRAEIQHRARLKYADGLLALPNPSRQHFQSEEVRQMLREMNYEDRNELNNMINDLFKLYDMDGFTRFTPSKWKSQYQSVGGQIIQHEVRIQGNQGAYIVNGVAHQLENIDIFNVENSDGGSTDIIAGNWRYKQGGNEAHGTFRWKLENDDHFDGVYSVAGSNQSLTWSGDRIPSPVPAE